MLARHKVMAISAAQNCRRCCTDSVFLLRLGKPYFFSVELPDEAKVSCLAGWEGHRGVPFSSTVIISTGASYYGMVGAQGCGWCKDFFGEFAHAEHPSVAVCGGERRNSKSVPFRRKRKDEAPARPSSSLRLCDPPNFLNPTIHAREE